MDAEAVRKAEFDAVRALRDHFLQVPDRIAPILATLDDPAQINHLLTLEINQTLRALALALRGEGEATSPA